MMARRRHHGPYRMTPARRAQLRRAQMISARKRRGKHIKIALGVAGTAAVAGTLVARHKLSGSALSVKSGRNTSLVTGKQLPTNIRGFKAGNTVGVAVGIRGHRVTGSYTHNKLIGFEGGAHDDTRDWAILKGGRTIGVKTPTHFGVLKVNRRTNKVTGRRVRSHIDKDAIPMYNPKTKFRSWPHVPAKIARETNRRLREQGMLA